MTRDEFVEHFGDEVWGQLVTASQGYSVGEIYTTLVDAYPDSDVIWLFALSNAIHSDLELASTK